MFVNVDKLHGKIREMKTNVVEVAAKMGIDKSTLYRKLAKNGAGLTVKDAQQLVEIGQCIIEGLREYLKQPGAREALEERTKARQARKEAEYGHKILLAVPD